MGLFNRKKQKVAAPVVKKVLEVRSPFDGVVVDLAKVPDQVFAQKMLGDGIAIDPTGSVVASPVSGEIISAFPTGHAYTIQTPQGYGILVHIGVDTVNLKGAGFKIVANQGNNVKSGDALCNLDLKVLKAKAASLNSPVLMLSDETAKQGTIELKVKDGQKVTKGELLYTIS